jgi:hypothetical protein
MITTAAQAAGFFNDKTTRPAREAAYTLVLMKQEPNPHYSFILRCWRDDRGLLRGQLIDAMSQQTHPFASLEELIRQISSLLPAGKQPQGSETDSEDT